MPTLPASALVSLLTLAASAFAGTAASNSPTPATGSSELKPAAEATSRELGALLSSQQARGTVTSGLVAHYEFEGNAQDSSGNALHGTLMNGATFTSSGAVGQALNLVGNSGFVALPPLMKQADACSIAFWLRHDGDIGGTVVGEGTFNDGGLVVGVAGLTLMASEFGQWPLQAPRPSSWRHHVLAVDSVTSQVSVYVNGAVQTVTAADPDPCGHGVAVEVGRLVGILELNGQVDDLRFYDRALLAGEAQELFELGRLGSQGRADVQLKTGPVNQANNSNFHWKGIDQLWDFWLYYREPGDTREIRFPEPDSIAYAPRYILLTWNDLNGQGLGAQTLLVALDCMVENCIPGHIPSGVFLIQTQLFNPSLLPVDLSLFVYQDLDLGVSFGDDTATLAPPILTGFETSMTLSSPDQEASTRARATNVSLQPFGSPPAYEVGLPGTLKAMLDDAALTELSNSGLPYGPADLGMVHQWDLTIPAQSSVFVLMETAFDPVVFADGFESGDTSVWSATTP